jgi:hypothetical protein
MLDLDTHLARLLCVDWVMKLGQDAGLPFHQWGSGAKSLVIGPGDGIHVTVDLLEAAPYVVFTCSDAKKQSLVDALVQTAVLKIRDGDLGAMIWFSTVCPVSEWQFSSLSGAFVERLNQQTRISGWRRLGVSLLVEFVEELPKDWNAATALFAPTTVAHVHIGVPAPCWGFFSDHVAKEALETVAATCTFALGRAVPLRVALTPTPAEQVPDLDRRQHDQAILTLARKGVPLDVLNFAKVLGGADVCQRLRTALQTFDAAIRQEHDVVACILYVVVAECLVAPRTNWRDIQVTKRFIEFFESLMPDELDEIVAHGNFEVVFGVQRGKKQPQSLRRLLLDGIYTYRSGNVHSGLESQSRGFIGASDDVQLGVRRSMFALFAEGAILRFIASPRSSVVGHPNLIDPKIVTK